MHCRRVDTTNPRITTICPSNVNNADVVIISIYMSWCDRTFEQTVEYEATVGCIQSIIDSHVGCYLLFVGDFNIPNSAQSTCSVH